MRTVRGEQRMGRDPATPHDEVPLVAEEAHAARVREHDHGPEQEQGGERQVRGADDGAATRKRRRDLGRLGAEDTVLMRFASARDSAEFLGHVLTPVVATAQVMLEPHVQDDERVPATHLVEVELGFTVRAVGPADRHHGEVVIRARSP